MSTASDAIDRYMAIAASQVGYFKKPGTRTKFGEWYGLPTGQWCAMFLSWVADQAGMTNIIPKHAYTPSGVNEFKSRGQWHPGTAGIRRGDFPYFDFPGAPNRVSHVAVVESVNSDGSVNTIEGNTSGPGGDQRNGGACLRKRRKAYIVGYGRPNWAAAPSAARDYLKKGDEGNAVRDLQNQLISAGFGVGASGADGSFGPATEAALKAFQAARGLEADGIAGKATFGVLSAVVHTPAPSAPAPLPPTFHGQRGVHTGKLTADGNFELVVDGDLGPATIARWQQVMGTHIDGAIFSPSELIKADQRFLNSVVGGPHIRALTGRSTLDVDGIEGRNTIRVRQFWLHNAMNPIHQKNLIGHNLDFDGITGGETIRVLQFALNNATSGSRSYGRV